jgi:hypothetical protein
VYPSPLPIRDLYVSNCPRVIVIFELLLSLPHNPFPLLLITPSKRFASPLSLRGTRAIFLLHKQFPGELETEVEDSSSHNSSNSLVARLTPGSLGWVDESTRDGDHARVRIPYISRFWHWLTGDHAIIYTNVYVQAL